MANPIPTNPYYNTTGANAGLYIKNDVLTNTAQPLQSVDLCCVQVFLPCAYKPNYKDNLLCVDDGNCKLDACVILNLLKSIAGAQALAAAGAPMTPGLTNTEIVKLSESAKLATSPVVDDKCPVTY